jgi:hypothetical protein
MNETQARLVRDLRVEHGCSYQTVARKFFDAFGKTKYCKDPESAIYSLDGETGLHEFDNGKLPKKARVIEYLFSKDAGESLCDLSRTFYKEDISGGWTHV